MQIKPILAALKRHKAGTVLIALQIALTLAIVCNALFIIHQRVSKLMRPTGVDEASVLTVQNGWVGVEDGAGGAQTKGDLLLLRGMPGVVDASFSNSYPLRGGGMSLGVKKDPDAKKPIAQTTIYFSDDHSINALGLNLVAGRNFLPQEVKWLAGNAFEAPAQVIVSKALADKVYPDGSALGKPIYVSAGSDGGKPSTIVGIVGRLEVPWTGNWSSNFMENSVMVPFQMTGSGGNYIIRAKPGALAGLVRSVPTQLFKANRMRVIPDDRGVRTFAEVREQAYQSDRGMAILMGIVCAVLLAITAAGIVGLTSFWVGQRRKQIGVRRALGATKHDILSYFLTENLLIGAAGVIVGAALAIGMNLWLVSHFEMERLSLLYVAAGVIALLLLGQGAVLAPAMKASRVPPVEATRSV